MVGYQDCEGYKFTQGGFWPWAFKTTAMTPEKIKEKMNEFGFRSQQDLANAVGISKTTMSKILNRKIPLSSRTAMTFEYLFEAEALYQENMELKDRIVQLSMKNGKTANEGEKTPASMS